MDLNHARLPIPPHPHPGVVTLPLSVTPSRSVNLMTDLPELRTPRLLLRPFRPDDLDLLHAMWTDPNMRRYLWDDIVISRETAQEVLASHRNMVSGAGIGFWLVLVQTTNQAAGFCGFRFIADTPDVELMYGLLPDFWGQGFAVEASNVALDYIWDKTPITRIWARTDPPNSSSVAVMERLGLTHHSTTATMITYFIDRQRPVATS
jgi:[ribosomal protein S5]-alanine N-acetyltransferase